MKKTIGIILVALGVISMGISGMNARNAPNISYLIGTFLPGIVFLIIGL